MITQQKKEKKRAHFVHTLKKEPHLVKVSQGIRITRSLKQKLCLMIEVNPKDFPNLSVTIEKICWEYLKTQKWDTLRQYEYHSEEAAKMKQRLENQNKRKQLIENE